MSTVVIRDARRAIQYTGSNSAEIDAALTDITIDSEAGGTLTFTQNGNQYSVSTGGWVAFYQGGVISVATNAEFEAQYDIDTPGQLSSFGSANVPALLLGASTTVAVQVSPAMPDSSYTPTANLVGAAGQLSITAVSVVDEDTVNVTVQAAVAYGGGAQVVVHATRTA